MLITDIMHANRKKLNNQYRWQIRFAINEKQIWILNIQTLIEQY